MLLFVQPNHYSHYHLTYCVLLQLILTPSTPCQLLDPDQDLHYIVGEIDPEKFNPENYLSV